MRLRARFLSPSTGSATDSIRCYLTLAKARRKQRQQRYSSLVSRDSLTQSPLAQMQAHNSFAMRHRRELPRSFPAGFVPLEITDRNAALTFFADLKTAAMSGSSTTAIVSDGISVAKRFGFAFE
jgi:hypothetical protein